MDYISMLIRTENIKILISIKIIMCKKKPDGTGNSIIVQQVKFLPEIYLSVFPKQMLPEEPGRFTHVFDSDRVNFLSQNKSINISPVYTLTLYVFTHAYPHSHLHIAEVKISIRHIHNCCGKKKPNKHVQKLARQTMIINRNKACLCRQSTGYLCHLGFQWANVDKQRL